VSIRQLSVFVENKSGRIADVVGTLADGGVNIIAFALADTTDYGILRLIVDRVEKAKGILEAGRFAVAEHPVGCAQMPHNPGALAAIARLVYNSGLNIEYMYLGAGYSLVLKTNEIESLERLLLENGFALLDEQELGQLVR
jgi:hypothetical protein